MKKICTTKKYDLSQLDINQLTLITNEVTKDKCANVFRNDIYSILGNEEVMMIYLEGWILPKKGNETELTNALELFKERLSNVKVDLKTPSDLTNDQREALMSMFKEEVKEEKTHDIYQRADQLMQDGKQHGLKIVVTFEKL